jgi:acyl-CoA synthetase (NDP forming)/GNAT superfamily N-acetyltransferase
VSAIPVEASLDHETTSAAHVGNGSFIDPATFLRDVVLIDGTTLRLRPSKPEDREQIERFHNESLSDTSAYMRFLGLRPHLSEAFIDSLTDFQPSSHVTLVGVRARTVVAVGSYFPSREPGAVEVAFAVLDSLQGLGIGTLMLEDLASIAKAAGFTKLTAQTLPDNVAMQAVFSLVGLRTTRHFDQGTVDVVIDLADDHEMRRRSEERDWDATVASMQPVLAPHSIVVVGASTDESAPGHRIAANLRASFQGPLAVVRPDGASVAGVDGYASLGDVPFDIDQAVIAVPRPAVRQVIEECGLAKVRAVVVVTAGFSERGDGDTDDELVTLAHRYGMRLVGPNCFGIATPAKGLNATFATVPPAAAGGIGFVSQSGGLGIALLIEAAERHIGMSSFVSLGNRSDVSSTDLLCAFGVDDRTRVVLQYLESIGNPRRLLTMARRVAARKPIVVLKSGRSAAGARGAASHTAAIATDDRSVDALLEAAGVIRVDTLEELFDLGMLLDRQPAPRGRRVAMIGNAGGPLVLAADTAERVGLVVPELSAELQARILALAPAAAATSNPVDLLATCPPEVLAAVVQSVTGTDEVDAVVVATVAVGGVTSEQICAALEPVDSSIPIAVSTASPVASPSSVAVFRYSQSAVAALARAAEWQERRMFLDERPPVIDDVDWVAIRTRMRASAPKFLPPAEVSRLLTDIGVRGVLTATARTADEAESFAHTVREAVAMKAIVPGLVHKTDAGAVLLGVEADAVRAAFHSLSERFAGAGTDGTGMHGVVLQPMMAPGPELLIGGRQDANSGPLLLVAAGGVEAELLDDNVVLAAPVSERVARDALLSLRTAPRLTGFRGSAPLDVDAVVDIATRISLLMELVPEVAEIDLNPVIAHADGAVVVDARIRIDGDPPVAHPLRTLG